MVEVHIISIVSLGIACFAFGIAVRGLFDIWLDHRVRRGDK